MLDLLLLLSAAEFFAELEDCVLAAAREAVS
jgi:hypothetical protein